MKKHNLIVSVIQTKIFWQNVDANLSMLEKKIMAVDEPTDIIILPEMFSTGFTMDAEQNAEGRGGKAFQKMVEWAKSKQVAICGSVIVEELGNFYNRLYFVKPNGEYDTYDKRHLFRMAEEDQHYSAGSEKVIVSYKGWKIRPLICYDLRFPVWSRNSHNEYDLLIYVANWPAPRSTAWQILLRARAAENLSYCIGVNRVGEDENGFHYSGNSAIVDFKGDVIFENENEEIIYSTNLSKKDLEEFREKFPAHLDADEFDIK